MNTDQQKANAKKSTKFADEDEESSEEGTASNDHSKSFLQM